MEHTVAKCVMGPYTYDEEQRRDPSPGSAPNVVYLSRKGEDVIISDDSDYDDGYTVIYLDIFQSRL
jgi:hypothetical protein